MYAHSAQAPESGLDALQPAQNGTESLPANGVGARREYAEQRAAHRSFLDVGDIDITPITSEELQQQGYSPSEANRLAARRNAEVNLRQSFLCFFRLWSCAFSIIGIVTVVYLCILISVYVEHRSSPCTKHLRWWTEVLYLMIAYTFCLHHFVVRTLCCYNPGHEESETGDSQAVPCRVSALLAFRTIFAIVWCVLGICISVQDTDCAPADVGRFSSTVMYFCIFYLLLIFHFSVLFTAPYVLLRHAYQRGWLQTTEGAPKGTSNKLLTVDVSNDVKFCETKDDGCSVCLDDFSPATTVVKKTPCGHYFHLQCIDKWLQVSRHCPICRTDIVLGVLPETPATKVMGEHPEEP
eukprot:GEMP01014092.1.p1 GENE.GEMP01014092.1~~GEMP01014092.1.p1  ORF type:complete len:352 (+),score=51.50 GEMP01014092.1:118-1173(+)